MNQKIFNSDDFLVADDVIDDSISVHTKNTVALGGFAHLISPLRVETNLVRYNVCIYNCIQRNLMHTHHFDSQAHLNRQNLEI